MYTEENYTKTKIEIKIFSFRKLIDAKMQGHIEMSNEICHLKPFAKLENLKLKYFRKNILHQYIIIVYCVLLSCCK